MVATTKQEQQRQQQQRLMNPFLPSNNPTQQRWMCSNFSLAFYIITSKNGKKSKRPYHLRKDVDKEPNSPKQIDINCLKEYGEVMYRT